MPPSTNHVHAQCASGSLYLEIPATGQGTIPYSNLPPQNLDSYKLGLGFLSPLREGRNPCMRRKTADRSQRATGGQQRMGIHVTPGSALQLAHGGGSRPK